MNGIWFGDVHSYDDLNLILSSVDIPPAEAKTNFVEIPGGDGSADLTEALGRVTYKDRKCSFEFAVFPYEDFEEKKREISNLLNGKRCRITLDKDPDYCWDGRCFVDSYKSDKRIYKITISATVAPYKLKSSQTKVSIPAGEKVTRTLWNSRKTVVPVITTTADAKIVFNGNTYNINAGTHKILNVELVEGGNPITVTSIGTVEFTYQEGDL